MMIRISQRISGVAVAVVVAAAVLIAGQGCSQSSPPPVVPVPAAQGPLAPADQKTFPTADAAAEALYDAAKSDNTAEMRAILGPEAQELIDSGDPVADANGREKFAAAWAKKHTVTDNGDGTATLIVGENDWPLPIPLVRDGGGEGAPAVWSFDASAGMEEILNRRIGRNELSAMQVCLAVVDAQRDYAMRDPQNSGVQQYAQKVVSDPGKKDGLYWDPAAGETESPLGPLVAAATEEGYTVKSVPTTAPSSTSPAAETTPLPYHGYCYHLLKQQGSHAAGGERDYIINGKMIGGFGVVAWPAEYGNSGIMTFIVNQDGVVYQRDLGEETFKLAEEITSFDPGPEWKKCD